MKRFLSSVLLVSTILAGCTQSSPIGTMDFEDESPLEIPAVGQELKLKVAWENVRWKISEQTEDASKSIISSIMPVYSGSTSGKGVTEVTVSIKENMTSVRKTAVLTLTCAEGTTDGRQRTLTITQAPLYVEGENDNALITVRSSTTYQTIDGFGGMNLLSNWGKRELLTDSEVDKVFGTNEMQLGLSIMRIRLHPEKNSWNIAVPSAKRAYEQYGVRILASPWSPPVYMKSNGSLIKGYLLEDKYEEYAEYLEEFARYMKDSGAPLYAVSIQNEPDWEPDYEGCVWNSGQIYDFVKNYGHLISTTRLAAAESLNMNHIYYDDLLKDDMCMENFDIVAGHIYGGGIKEYPLAAEKGKPVWMTEHLLQDGYPTDAWGETMQMVNEIHDCMSAGWNAYIWWYIKRYYSLIGDGDHGTRESQILPRGYAFAQYSRYIRPGYKRIQADSGKNTDIAVTAYTGDGKTIVVMINNGLSDAKDVKVGFGHNIDTAVATCTSKEESSAGISCTKDGDAVILDLKSRSITTLVVS